MSWKRFTCVVDNVFPLGWQLSAAAAMVVISFEMQSSLLWKDYKINTQSTAQKKCLPTL